MKQRIIKFRVWDKDTISGRPQMVYWKTDYAGGCNDDFWEKYGDKHLMQYTGLKDKNGKEIYEGDIIETKNSYKFVVKWNDYCAMWALDGIEGFMMKLPDGSILPQNECCKVIGNIFENPELLNQ